VKALAANSKQGITENTMSEKATTDQEAGSNTSAGNPTAKAAADGAEAAEKNPVKKWTVIVLVTVVVLLAYHLYADRYAPVTSQARVHALVVPVASEVSGTVIAVDVSNNQVVKAGQPLFRIDPERYQLALEKAEADMQSARQSMGASSAGIGAAEASLASARANLVRAEKDTDRFKRIREEDPGAVSQRRLESAEASLEVARGQVDAARANLEKAKQALGEVGEENPVIQQARSALEQARLNLESTIVRAPEMGVVTDVRVNNGNFANASAPQMTFISMSMVWIQADFTENNLGHIDPGDTAKIVFDALPGKVLEGKVTEIGFGVAVDSAPLGSLPTIQNDRNWLRDAQRYPVLVDFDFGEDPATLRLKVGSQATVAVLTGTRPILNFIAGLRMRINSILTYAY
jgi:multidrug resistance efflux pump